MSAHYHAVVWIDHREARVFHFNASDAETRRKIMISCSELPTVSRMQVRCLSLARPTKRPNSSNTSASTGRLSSRRSSPWKPWTVPATGSLSITPGVISKQIT